VCRPEFRPAGRRSSHEVERRRRPLYYRACIRTYDGPRQSRGTHAGAIACACHAAGLFLAAAPAPPTSAAPTALRPVFLTTREGASDAGPYLFADHGFGRAVR